MNYEINELEKASKSLFHPIREKDIHFLCIGTDRSTGDSLGPLVGSKLMSMGYTNVSGTLDNPVHAMNLNEEVGKIKNKIVIAVDACLGKLSSVGKVNMIKGQLNPGAGINKDLGGVGDYAIKGIVNVAGFMEYFVLQNTRLSIVMNMADEIVKMISSRFPLGRAVSEIAASKEE